MEHSTITPFPAKQMTNLQRKSIALQAIKYNHTDTAISNQLNVSHKFNAKQRVKMTAEIDQALGDKEPDDNKILFNLPVTKVCIEQFSLCLMLHGRTSFRGIQHVLKDILDYDISVSGIYNISVSAKQAAVQLNANQDLSPMKLAAHDEIFHHNKPVLAGVDIPSLYCYLLSQEDQRDCDTWAIHFLDLQQQGFKPERVIGDDGTGLRAAHKIILPDVPFDYDHFHLTKLLMDTRRYFRNCHKTSVTQLIAVEYSMDKAKEMGQPFLQSRKLGKARKHEELLRLISQTIDTLVSWMEHDVLNMTGPTPEVRKELYNFILDEFEKLAMIHPDRLKALCVTLKAKKELSLAFCDVLEAKLQRIAQTHDCSLTSIWGMCQLLRCNLGGDTYGIRSIPLQDSLGDKYDDVEDAVIIALSSTERTSSMVENLNSRLRTYFCLRQDIGNGYLDLLRFFLNHKPFEKRCHPNRKGKSPAEILAGKSHPLWLELLGYTRFRRAA